MSWPSNVKDEVLVKCGRHCCICHKFCGIKMELHHIKLKSKGGEETLENCIPLCLNCHADQSSYDHNHPKGTKYSEKELLGHRDKWFKMASNNLGTGTNDHLDQDRELYYWLLEKIPSNPLMWNIKDLNFKQRYFDMNVLIPLFNLVYEMEMEIWIEFFDSDIQSRFEYLIKTSKQFEKMVTQNTFPAIEPEQKLHCVPREWIESEDNYQPEIYNAVTNDLNSLVNEIYNAYSEFIKICRKKLGVLYFKQNPV